MSIDKESCIGLVRASFEAYERKDRALIERVIADDFHFTSPLDNAIDRETYLARCWPNSASVERFDIKHLVAAGERVFVTYEGHNTDGHVFRNTEIFTCRDDRIVAVEVYFGWSIPHEASPGGFIDEKPD